MSNSVFPMYVPGRTGVGALRDGLADRREGIRATVGLLDADEFAGGGAHNVANALTDALLCDEFRWSEPETIDGARTRHTYECTDPTCPELRRLFGAGSHRHSVDMASAVVDVIAGDMSLLQYFPSGSHVPLDRAFISARGRTITILYFLDQPSFGTEIYANLCSYFEAANSDIREHNGLVRGAVDRHIERRMAKLRKEQAAIESTGWAVRRRGADPVPYRLPDARRRDLAPRPAPLAEEANFQLSRDDFTEVLQSIADWANSAERYPGVAAGRGENELRNSLLAALNVRFVDATGEAFSRSGKTDIRVLVRTAAGDMGPQVFHAECKVWSGPASVDKAVSQLVEKYLTHRDRLGALIFFVTDLVDVEAVAPKAQRRLIDLHGGSARPPVAGWPVIEIPSPSDPDRVVELAVVAVHIPGAIAAEDEETPAQAAGG